MTETIIPPKVKWIQAQQAKLVTMVTAPWSPGPDDVPQESFKAAMMLCGSFLPAQRGNLAASTINLILTFLVSPNAQTKKDAQFTAMIQKLVNPAVSLYDTATIAAQLRGCQMQFDNFYQHLDILTKSPNEETKKEAVRIAFQGFENSLSTDYIFLAQKAGSELDTLDEFAIMATFHLMILREAIIQRYVWGFAESTIGNYIEKFDRCIVQYRAYVDKWYNYGYDRIVVPIAADKYPFMTFNRINYYTTTMTLYVYDFVNFWWTLDPRTFPKPGVSYERVRYVYTDLLGVPYGSKTDENTYICPYPEIENEFNNEDIHLYQNELTKINYVRDDYRLIKIQPVYYESGATNNERLGDWVGGVAMSPSFVNQYVPMDDDRDPATCPRTAIVKYDLLPKVITFYSNQAATIGEARITTPKNLPSVSGIEDTYIKAYTTRSPKLGYPGNKVGNIMGMGYNNDMTLLYKTNNLPILDSIAIGFIGEEVFSENLIFSQIATIIDAQKYKTSTDDTNVTQDKTLFVRDANGLGQHGITLISPGNLQYEFSLESKISTILKFRASVLVSSCTVLGLMQLLDTATGAAVLSTFVPVGTTNKVIHFMGAFGFKDVANQKYTLQFTGSCTICSLIFTPLHLVTPIPAFPPSNAVTPTTPNNPASYTDKKQWMAVQQANTNYSVLTLKEFVPPDVYNPMNYYKIMICCALNFVPGIYGPILAGITDIFLSFIIDYNSEDNTLTRYRLMLYNLVDTTISVHDNEITKAQYAGCAQSYHDFMLCLANFNATPNDAAVKELVRISFANIENDVGCKYIYLTRKSGREVAELMMFGLFATTHLTLLREVIMNGEKWGFDPKTVTLYKNKFYKHIIEYRDYAIDTYNKGYAAISAKTLFNAGFLYNNLNEYRNMMITSVFDMVNIWFMFDPAIYANVGITHERVRYLFSKIYGTANPQTLPEIEALVAQYGYHQYQGELNKLETVLDQYAYKFSEVSPTFTKNGSFKKGTELTAYSTSEAVITSEVKFAPKQACTSVKVRYDYFPRQLDFQSSGATTSIATYAVSDANRIFNDSYTNLEMDWYNIYNYTSFKGQGGITITASEADHKLGNCFTLDINNNPNIMNPQVKKARGFVDGLILAWLPTEVFTDNFVEDSMITMIDAQKFSAKSANTTFAKDFFMPGVHAMTLPPTAWIEFEFKLRVATANEFTVMLRFDCKDGSSCTLLNKDKAAETFVFGLLVNDRAVYVPTEAKNIKMDKAGVNTYRITNTGWNPFTLQSILFRPKGK
eukprot:gene1349-1543_t